MILTYFSLKIEHLNFSSVQKRVNDSSHYWIGFFCRNIGLQSVYEASVWNFILFVVELRFGRFLMKMKMKKSEPNQLKFMQGDFFRGARSFFQNKNVNSN